MRQTVLLDTGPLVAFLNRRDQHHAWAKEQLGRLEPPMLTCEAVISEGCFLLRHDPSGADAILELIARGLIVLPFRLAEELHPVRRLLRRYANVPMSFADACLVRMGELHSRTVVLTTDGQFKDVYRKNRKQVIPTIMPAS